jgi:hypothetical protein
MCTPSPSDLCGYPGPSHGHRRRTVAAVALLPIGWPIYYLLSRRAWVAYDIRLELSADMARVSSSATSGESG